MRVNDIDVRIAFFIPSRANSQRFPNKSVAELGNKPLIVHSIDFALANCTGEDSIHVCTNDEVVMNLAKELNVPCLSRSPEVSLPSSKTIDVIQYSLASLGEFDYLVLLQPTNPLRPQAALTEMLERMITEGRDSTFSVSRSTHKLGSILNNRFKPLNYAIGDRSQDMTPLFYENGLLYIASRQMIAQGELINEASLPYIIDHPFGTVDIDYPEDLNWATFLLHEHGK